MLIFHVSNRYYEFRPVIKALAKEMNLYGALNLQIAKDHNRLEKIDTSCVVLAANRSSLQPLLDIGWKLFGADGLVDMSSWTDDYNNILEPLQDVIKTRYRAWKINLSF